MPTIKKTPLNIDNHLISKREVIDTLIITDRGFNILSDKDRHELNVMIYAFQKAYGHSHFDTLVKIKEWLPSVVQDIRVFSALEVYGNYESRLLSQFDVDPVKYSRWTGHHWVFKGFIYEVKGHYSDEQIRLLILEDFDKERTYFEKLKSKFDEAQSSENKIERPRIPESVRIQVWRRDGGKCARCGSREKLEYDHIVPISKGGSNTARNIELLCENHNRSKSNNVV